MTVKKILMALKFKDFQLKVSARKQACIAIIVAECTNFGPASCYSNIPMRYNNVYKKLHRVVKSYPMYPSQSAKFHFTKACSKFLSETTFLSMGSSFQQSKQFWVLLLEEKL